MAKRENSDGKKRTKPMKYLLGIDIGTSSCKCVLLDLNGKLIANRSSEYTPIMTADGASEQDPSDWYHAMIECLNDFKRNDNIELANIQAICPTGQMQGATFIGTNGEHIRKSILWNDIRCEYEVDILNQKYTELFINEIGFAATTALTISKLIWLKNREPENFNQISKFLLAPNYIGYKLTGEYVADVNNITLSGLNSLQQNCWSPELQKISEIPLSYFPKVVNSFSVIGTVTEKAAFETGLPVGAKVIAGGGDAASESFSIGISNLNKLKIRLGSAADINLVVPLSKLPVGVWPGIRDVVDNHILIGQYTKACAASVKWIRNTFFSELVNDENSYSKMDLEAKSIPIGSENLIYHPFLFGENAPYFDSSLRASYHGINGGHTRAHFLRAGYEGISFSIRDVLESVPNFMQAEEIIFVGGGTKSSLWVQILCDVIGKSALIAENCDAAFGAALMAGEGSGVLNSKEVVANNLRNSKRVEFNPENHKKYSEIFSKYRELVGK